MTQIGGEQEQSMPLWSEDPSRRGRILIRNRHDVTEIIIGRLEFQLTRVVSMFRADVEDRAQLGVAMAVGLNRSTVIGTNHRPSLLNVDLRRFGPSSSSKYLEVHCANC